MRIVGCQVGVSMLSWAHCSKFLLRKRKLKSADWRSWSIVAADHVPEWNSDLMNQGDWLVVLFRCSLSNKIVVVIQVITGWRNLVAFRNLCREDESKIKCWSKHNESVFPAKKTVVAYQVSLANKRHFWNQGIVVAVCLNSFKKAKLAGSSVFPFQNLGIGEDVPVWLLLFGADCWV